jgi:hypothetical protein
MIDSINKFLNDEQDPRAVEKVYTRIKDLLTSDETLEYIAVQKKPAVNISPDSVAITNKRIIFFRSKNLGLTMDFEDYIWRDVVDCHMKEGILGAEFTLKPVRGLEIKIDFLPKVQARKLYQLAQQREEEQREVRRQLDLEEKRATAGGVTVANFPTENTPVTVTPSAPAPTPVVAPEPIQQQQPSRSSQEDPTVALQKLKSLFDNGLITAHDFETKKAEILSRL